MEIKRVSELSDVLMDVLLLPYPQIQPIQSVEIEPEEDRRRRCEGSYRPGGDVTGQDDLPCNSLDNVKFVGGQIQEYWCESCRRIGREGEYAL